jgi:DNA-binding CsgD family transcriptional regulator
MYYAKALKLIEPYDLNYEKSKILAGMYQCYKQLGLSDSALLYLEQYKTMGDSLNKVDVTNKLTELEGKYQQEKNLAKIASLNENMYREKSKYRLNIIILSSTLFLILLYVLFRRHKNHNKYLKGKIIEKENKFLEIELQGKQKELAIKAMHMARLNELSYNVSQKLKDVSLHVSGNNKEEIKSLIVNLETSAPKNAWKEFELRFENVHQGFYNVLTELHPELTPTEIKICSLIRLNMSSKDIAVLTNRSIRTIESTRTNIRKKLNLSSETSLTGYLLSI